MPNITFDFRSGGGLVADSNQFTLQPNEWSDVNNVRFHNRAVSKIAGHSRTLTLDHEPRHSIFIDGYNNDFYYYIDTDGDTYRVDAADSESKVTKGTGGTPAPLDTDTQYQMNAVHGGYTMLVNDGSNTPQYITSVGNGTDTTELTDIPGWDYSDAYENVHTASIRPFKYVLIAMGITQTNSDTMAVERNAGTVRVSNQAAPGAFPTWNPNADNADTADEFELAQNGEIIDGVALGDSFMIFTRNEIYSLRLSSSTTSPVTVSKQLSGRGMLSTSCGVEFFGRLFVVGPEDLYVFQGGAGTKSVADERVRDEFFNSLNTTHYKNTFVIHNEREDEIWVCYPDTTSTGACNRALIWNYHQDVWTKRDLPNVYEGSSGPLVASEEFSLNEYYLQLPSVDSDYLFAMDQGTTFDGEQFTAYVERKGLDLAPNNPGLSAWNDSIYFLATGEGQLDIKVRATDTPGRPVDFASATDRFLASRTFNIDGDMADLKINPRVDGKFMNIRIEGQDDWHLHSYTVSFEAADMRSET